MKFYDALIYIYSTGDGDRHFVNMRNQNHREDSLEGFCSLHDELSEQSAWTANQKKKYRDNDHASTLQVMCVT